jgi:serine/threonine-protein kinase
MAYTSGESGKGKEVYVRPFPGPGGKWPISIDGGSNPVWSRNGKELFYSNLSHDQIMVANYTASGDTFRAEKPRLWSAGQIATNGGQRTYDLAPDGKRFVVLKKLSEGVAAPPIDKVTFVFNFFDELRAKVPAGKN